MKTRRSNFAVTFNGMIIKVAGIAVTFDVYKKALQEVIRRERLMRAGALPRGEYGVKAVES
jgi:hypothetical protein